MSANGDTPESPVRTGHPVRNWLLLIAGALTAFVVWIAVTIHVDDGKKEAAKRACEHDVAAKYYDRDALVFSELEGRDGDRFEYSVTDMRGEFHWTCFASKQDGEWVADSFK